MRRMWDYTRFIISQLKHNFPRFLPSAILLLFLGSIFITCLSANDHDHSHTLPAAQLSARSSVEIQSLSAAKLGNYKFQGELISTDNYSSTFGNHFNTDSEISNILFLFLALFSLRYFVLPLMSDKTRLKRTAPRTHLILQRFLN